MSFTERYEPEGPWRTVGLAVAIVLAGAIIAWAIKGL